MVKYFDVLFNRLQVYEQKDRFFSTCNVGQKYSILRLCLPVGNDLSAQIMELDQIWSLTF